MFFLADLRKYHVVNAVPYALSVALRQAGQVRRRRGFFHDESSDER